VYRATDIANSKSWCGSKDNKWKLAPSLDLEAATKTDVSKTTRKDKPLDGYTSITYLLQKV
jgi:hypothetical protein